MQFQRLRLVGFKSFVDPAEVHIESGLTGVVGPNGCGKSNVLESLRWVMGANSAKAMRGQGMDDVIFAGELRMLARRGHIRLVEIHTRTDGRLDPARLDELVDEVDQRRTWACGPSDMLDAIETRWAAAGIAGQLHIERFRATLIATGDGGAVTFSASGTTVDADGTRSLLDTGESAGVLMPSGCRMGICFGCVAPLRRGAVRDLRTGALTTANDGDGVVIQTCVSAAAGDCDIDL
jgi:ferredoxin